MAWSWNRCWGVAGLFLTVPTLVSCLVVSEGPELPTCASTVSREPTGDLAVDLVGAWNGTISDTNGQHPIAYMASISERGMDHGRRIWMFREDGTGHVWWSVSEEHGRFGNEEEFVWVVANGLLVVNDLAPAVVDVYSEDNFLLHPIDEDIEPERGVLARRCDLEVPEGVRDLDR